MVKGRLVKEEEYEDYEVYKLTKIEYQRQKKERWVGIERGV